ncbi:DeHydroCholesterol Reductase [Trichostrongylus colubriformis]|uniref:7-dehydrocholesterol reductase n=1 Tax=Trichostrongylus colubriformis TaxID=6319 RepID=A0AAN8FKB7_TRICO
MQQRILRRTSFGGSSSSLRRSSISSKDLQAIQAAIAKQHHPTPLILCLLIGLPVYSFFHLYLIYHHHGYLGAALSSLVKPPILAGLVPLLFDVAAWKFTVVFLSLQLIFHWILPHDNVYLLSSTGDRKKPVNGFSSCLLLCLLYVMGSGLGMYRNDVLYIHFESVIICMAIICVAVWLAMLINYRFGDYYNVTTVPEFCFGVELYPTVLDIDIKHFVRSRITLVLWPLFIISAVFHQRNVYGKVSQSLITSSMVQMAYIIRNQWTENLALNSVDYRRSNCGFYKLWSDMVMFPVLYCSSIAIIAHTQKSISSLSCCVLMITAFVSIYMTTVIDKQKYDFRRSKGLIKIRGVDPYFITAKYKTDTGDTSANLLLGSGYWATCRHPNYISEAVTFIVFSAFQGPYPIACHLTAIFVTGFLFIRLCNDESRCLIKYGQSWIQYCNKVPFRLIPGLY